MAPPGTPYVTTAGLADVEGQDKKNKSSMATETEKEIGVRYFIKAQEAVSAHPLCVPEC
jgi:hypothetical protein